MRRNLYDRFQDAWDLAGNNGDGDTKDGSRIDHAWVSDGLAHRVGTAWVDGTAAGSDHQPAWFEIDL